MLVVERSWRLWNVIEILLFSSLFCLSFVVYGKWHPSQPHFRLSRQSQWSLSLNWKAMLSVQGLCVHFQEGPKLHRPLCQGHHTLGGTVPSHQTSHSSLNTLNGVHVNTHFCCQ